MRKLWVVLISVLVGLAIFGVLFYFNFPWKDPTTIRYPLWIPEDYYEDVSYYQQNELLRSWIEGKRETKLMNFEDFQKSRLDVCYIFPPERVSRTEFKVLWIGKKNIKDQVILFTTKEVSVKEFSPWNKPGGGWAEMSLFKRDGNTLVFTVKPEPINSWFGVLSSVIFGILGGLLVLLFWSQSQSGLGK